MIINLIPAVSPFLPITSILPLVFVLAVSMIKEAVEDAARYDPLPDVSLFSFPSPLLAL